LGAKVTVCPISEVHDTIEALLANLRSSNMNPFFIPGGGHGNTGTQAYVDCYEEIREWEERSGIYFDCIFLPSGTGTTQAGLVCGQLLHRDERQIIGISIARRNPYGRQVVVDSVTEYLQEDCPKNAAEKVIFLDDYILSGYGSYDSAVSDTIHQVLCRHGIALNPVYTGKAFCGMEKHIRSSGMTGNGTNGPDNGSSGMTGDTGNGTPSDNENGIITEERPANQDDNIIEEFGDDMQDMADDAGNAVQNAVDGRSRRSGTGMTGGR